MRTPRHVLWPCLVVLLAACSDRQSIEDARMPATLILSAPKASTHAYAIRVRVRGEIDGSATIALMLHGGPYKTRPLSGKVDFIWDGDWYEDTAEVRYTPNDVRSGRLSLEYEFDTL